MHRPMAQSRAEGDSFQDKGQGYDADSETDGSEFKGPASDRAEAGSTQTADSEHDEDQKQQSIGERRVSKPEEFVTRLKPGRRDSNRCRP